MALLDMWYFPNTETKEIPIIEAVVEKTGWSKRKTTREMQRARANCGISFRDYLRYEFHMVPRKAQKRD